MEALNSTAKHEVRYPEFDFRQYVSEPVAITALIIIAILIVWREIFPVEGNRKLHVPIVGPTGTVRARWEFFRNASTLVSQGYNQVSNTSMSVKRSSE